ncbi:hypothetical protein RB195_022427 [Necator americanus]|uniref:Endonuclease/exonuclease/phosphatase domain-containing protein n=1 Tax=Necator americanus TaxID=51031 RepID=A0ABR1EFX6_NECAM
MWFNASLDNVHRLHSNIKLRRSRFYMDLEKFYNKDHTFYEVIIANLNAKIGPRRTPEELHIGTHGPQWNEQKERLSEFIMTTKTIHRSSQFQLSSLRWTWESSAEGHHSEIDHIMVSKRFCLTDLPIVPKIHTRSNHRFLRGGFSFTRKEEKAARFTKRTPRTIIDWELFAPFVGFWEDTVMDNIDDEYERLVEHLEDCTRKAKSFETTKRRMSSETLELRASE